MAKRQLTLPLEESHEKDLQDDCHDHSGQLAVRRYRWCLLRLRRQGFRPDPGSEEGTLHLDEDRQARRRGQVRGILPRPGTQGHR